MSNDIRKTEEALERDKKRLKKFRDLPAIFTQAACHQLNHSAKRFASLSKTESIEKQEILNGNSDGVCAIFIAFLGSIDHKTLLSFFLRYLKNHIAVKEVVSCIERVEEDLIERYDEIIFEEFIEHLKEHIAVEEIVEFIKQLESDLPERYLYYKNQLEQ